MKAEGSVGKQGQVVIRLGWKRRKETQRMPALSIWLECKPRDKIIPYVCSISILQLKEDNSRGFSCYHSDQLTCLSKCVILAEENLFFERLIIWVCFQSHWLSVFSALKMMSDSERKRLSKNWLL